MNINKTQLIRFIKATISSIVSAAVDLGIFFVICRNNNNLSLIIVATLIARIASGIVNFLINKYWAFESSGEPKEEIIEFTILFIIKVALSALLVWIFRNSKINQMLLKAIIDFALFFGSYVIQSTFIFNEREN